MEEVEWKKKRLRPPPGSGVVLCLGTDQLRRRRRRGGFQSVCVFWTVVSIELKLCVGTSCCRLHSKNDDDDDDNGGDGLLRLAAKRLSRRLQHIRIHI